MGDITVLSPVMKSFLAGSLSGTCSTVLFQPLDLVKTRLQTKTALPIRPGGMLSVFGQVVKTDRVTGLWKGITPSMMRCVPGVGLYFSSLHWLKGAAGVGDTPPGPLTAVALGMVARTISGVTMIPMTVIKTRFESDVYRYGCIREAVRQIYQREGGRGFRCGLSATLLRDAPFSGLYFMFYTQLKQLYSPELYEGRLSSLCHLSCGMGAGLMASTLTQPFDVIKTKMQLYPDKFDNIFKVAQYVHAKYGYTGFMKGLTPRLLRRSLMAAMAWTVYEKVMVTLKL